jgi:transglutaminase-like putative cysteine protease
MRYRIVHTTRYLASDKVSVGQNQAWLKPRICDWQRCLKHRLKITPEPSVVHERLDYFGNPCLFLAFNEGYQSLAVTARSVVEVRPRAWPAAETTPPWTQVAEEIIHCATPDERDAAQFRFDSPRAAANTEAREFARASFTPGRPILAALHDLTARVHRDFKYQPNSTSVNTSVSEVFKLRKGVCQDFAHLEIAALRSMGLAARYVSGYLRTQPAPGKPRLVGADATHAWLSVYCGAAGWIDVDPTNNVAAGLDHITLAWGRDYGDVPPLKGVFIGGGDHRLEVNVDVAPEEEPRSARSHADSNGEEAAAASVEETPDEL